MKPNTMPVCGVPVDHLEAADQQDPDGHERGQQLDAGEVGGVEVDGRHVRVAVGRVEVGEAADVALLLAERAHDADPRQRLLQVAGDRARSARACGGTRRRRRSGRRARRRPAAGSRGTCRARARRPSASRITTMPTSVSVDWKSVTIPSLTSELSASTSFVMRLITHAGAHARVEAERERLQVAEQLHAQVLQRALADPAGQVGLRGGRAPRDDRGEHEHEHDAVQRAGVLVLDAVVDRLRRERDRRRARRRSRRSASGTSARRGRGRAAAARSGRAACVRGRPSGAGGGAARRGGPARGRPW